ncbi:MAG: hypothetical protein ACU84H_03225 [Gammaproteobacteria bacterium]
MLKNKLLMALIASFLGLFLSFSTFAQSEEMQQEEAFNQPIQKLTESTGDIPVYSHIYGANFMTEQERCNYLLKLDSMKSKKERDAFRAKHREEIDQLRKEKGG